MIYENILGRRNVKLDNCTFLKAMNLFEVPEKFHEVAKLMLTEEEIELIAIMGRDKFKENELMKIIMEKNLSEGAGKFIFNSYSRAVLSKEIEDNELLYKITNLQQRFPYFAQYEVESWSTVAKEMKKELNDLHLEIYMSIYEDDVHKKINGESIHIQNSDFLTLDEADEIIDKCNLIYIVPCDCKSMMYYHDKPVNVCINFASGLNSQLDRGHGDKISKERAKELIREFNKKGLMQNGEDYAICNCDGVCCYPLQMAKKLGSRHIYPKSNYHVRWDKDNCLNCGKCIKICNFGAFYFDENKKVQYDPQKCWECTICVPNCPKKAINLIKK